MIRSVNQYPTDIHVCAKFGQQGVVCRVLYAIMGYTHIEC